MYATLCRRWWMLLLRGVLFILVGITAIVMPEITVVSLMMVFGAFTLADGIVGIAVGLGGAGQGRVWWPMVLLGVLALLAGLTAVVYPGLSALVMLFIIAISAMLRGIMEVAAAIALRKELDDEWVLALSGALSIGFGSLLLIRPLAGEVVLMLMFGAWMLGLGMMAVALALRLRRLANKLTQPQ